MAISTDQDLPIVLKVKSDPIKKYVFSQLGYPIVDVELDDSMLETAIRVSGDFISQYFPREDRLAVFYTSPLRPTYPMPKGAYWVKDVKWDPASVRIDDLFGPEAFIYQIGLTGHTSNILTDLAMLQMYRKFSQKILGTEGHFEVINEVDGDATQQLIRLYPTPKGTYPVVVLYMPEINHFRSPTAKMLAYEMITAEAKIMLGSARRKISGIPLPGGGNLSLDGEALVNEGKEEKKDIIQKAISLGDPMPIYTF